MCMDLYEYKNVCKHMCKYAIEKQLHVTNVDILKYFLQSDLILWEPLELLRRLQILNTRIKNNIYIYIYIYIYTSHQPALIFSEYLLRGFSSMKYSQKKLDITDTHTHTHTHTAHQSDKILSEETTQ